MDQATVPIKSKLPPSRETRLVSRETHLKTNEMGLERNETSALEVPTLRIRRYSKPVLRKTLICIISYRLARYTRFSFSSAVDVYHNLCVLQILKRPILFHIHWQNLFYSSWTLLKLRFCIKIHADKIRRYLHRRRQSIVFTNMFYSFNNSPGCVDLKTLRFVSSLMSVVKTIEVDPRVPGIRDKIPFPQAKQCSPELDFPQLPIQGSVQSEIQCLQEKLIVTMPPYGGPCLPLFFL